MNRRRRVRSLAALWLALAAIVLLYTDRNAYTWTFDAEDIAAIWTSAQQAQEDENAAQASMAQEREDAQARTAQGLWGKKDEYGEDFTYARPAVDDTLGLNLMWGDYQVTLCYASPEDLSVRVVSAGRQSFIQAGEALAPAGQGSITFSFALSDSAEQVHLACDMPDGASITQVTVKKAGQRGVSPDLAAYALLAGIVLSVLLVLSWDRSPAGAARRRDALVLVGAAALASMPLFWSGIRDGHDLLFHLNRIEGIASGLRAGQFPVRIHASTLLGYGYAASVFYPELFLYIPAFLRNMGVSLAACVRVFELIINLMTALVCFLSMRSLTGKRSIALGASVLYTLCIYRLANLYTRATLGESLAMIFFPLLLLAMVHVLTRDARRWPLLALAMTGIFMSHLLSTLFACVFCALAALVCLPRLVREPARILAILKAAGVTLLCALWFLIPMLSYTAAGISTSVVINSNEHVLQLGSFLVGFSGDMGGAVAEDYAYTIGVVPGLALLVGCALLLVRRYARGRDASCPRLALACLALGAAALLGATDVFPWDVLCVMRRPISTLFMQLQFPWRLVGVAAPLLSLAAAYGYLGDEKHRSAGFALLIALCVVFSSYTLQTIVQQPAVLEEDGFCDSRVEQYEYTYLATEKSALTPGYIVVNGDDAVVSDVNKQGTNISFTLHVPQGYAYVEVPLLYYPGYKATLDGEAVHVARGENNVLRIYGAAQGEDVQVRVWFEAPTSWLAAQAASAAGFALLLALLVHRRRA